MEQGKHPQNANEKKLLYNKNIINFINYEELINSEEKGKNINNNDNEQNKKIKFILKKMVK